MMDEPPIFDYVIVGGGTSGCIIASKLANALPACRILLVEAGPDDSEDPDNLIPGLIKPKFGGSKGNWLYETAPQHELGGRQIIYPRGKGLGGCSANNFMAWVRGPRCDYDDWAEIVGDPWWAWNNVKRVLKELEDFDSSCPEGMKKYAQPTIGIHGKGGPVAVQFNSEWQPIIEHCLDASQQAGFPLNLDNNDGDSIGTSVAQFTVRNGTRVTSANAYLGDSQRTQLQNLKIIRNTLCSRIIMKHGQAVGVELIPANESLAPQSSSGPLIINVSREVILTAGTFQSAQLLLLSGIGPRKDLEVLDIPVDVDLPGVGQKIRDHSAFACEYIISPDILGHNQVLNSKRLFSAAMDEYQRTKTGPLATFGASAVLIFPRLQSVFSSEEFRQADESVQSFLSEAGRPSTEIWMHSGPLFYTGACPPDASVLVLEGLNQNCLSEGTLRLRNRNPRDLPLIDPQYMAHPLDKRVAIETLQAILALVRTSAFSKIIQQPLQAPAGDREEELDNYIRDNLTQGFHSMGSCVMGTDKCPQRVVTNRFEVLHTRGLRVADMSVCPILTNNHTQVNAYLIALRCAEVILEDVRETVPMTARI